MIPKQKIKNSLKLINNTMSTFRSINTFPFTTAQIRMFRREIEKAGGTDELMLEKKALKREGNCMYIAIYKEIEEYKEKFLTGVYEPLREHYNTEIPYVFWSKLYEMLRKVNPKVK